MFFKFETLVYKILQLWEAKWKKDFYIFLPHGHYNYISGIEKLLIFYLCENHRLILARKARTKLC